MTRTMTPADYAKLLDPEMQAFVATTGAHYPPDAATLTIAGQREVYDRMCAAFRAPRPAGVTVRDADVAGVPVRDYSGKGAAVLYLHGGGFVVGGLDSHDDVCAEICARTGFRVVSADYRLSPEHAHPAAFDDALAVARWLAGQGLPMVLAGDSAGGNLAAAAAHAMRGDVVQAVGQVLIYPGLGGDRSLPSYTEHADAPMLTRADIEFYDTIRGVPVVGDATRAPLQDHDFSGLPPTVAIPAECDPLRDDAVAYVTAIRSAGGQAECLMQPGWLHGGLRARHSAAVAARAFDAVVAAISGIGRGTFCPPDPLEDI